MVAPGCTVATGLPIVHRSWVQSCSTYSIGLSASGPTTLAKPSSTSLRRSSSGSMAHCCQDDPPMKDNSTPTFASLGLLSNVVRTTPLSSTPDPDRPAARQKGVL